MCSTDFDPAAVYRVEPRRGRKPHVCCECYLTIPVGAEHVCITGLWEGGWSQYRRHLECHGLCDIIETVECGNEGTVLLGGLSEEIRNLEHGPYDEETDTYAPNWAETAFDAIQAKYAQLALTGAA